MSGLTVAFHPSGKTVAVPPEATIAEAARLAGVEIAQPCGGQGRCGRCAVVVESGDVRRRSTVRLSASELEAGYALACQTVLEGNSVILVPEQEKIARRLVTDKTARQVALPFDYRPALDQTVAALPLSLSPPSLTDATDDVSRLERALGKTHNLPGVSIPLVLLRELGPRLREAAWEIVAVVETDDWRHPQGPARLIDVLPRPTDPAAPLPLYGLAVDIGTTTVSVFLVDLVSGEVVDSGAEYNGQIARGEDVISRIIYASKGDGLAELAGRVRGTINDILAPMLERSHVTPRRVVKAAVVGNTTMIHLFLGLPPTSIRLEPYVPAINHPAPVLAQDVELTINPAAPVDCLPGVASYVGADITAGVLASRLGEAEGMTLFIDVGTNGEMALGTQDWLVACACSAGPAFEGAGVVCGMRATTGAIEEVWIDAHTFEPTYRVIGEVKPKGLCGSGLISLLAEMVVTGVVDKGGRLNVRAGQGANLAGTPRLRQGSHGAEYVVAWAAETAAGQDIVLTEVDIDNLMRAKAAIYAGFTMLAQSVGVDLADVGQMLIGGSFGKYLNVEKAVQIGLLPDMPWDRFQFLGNTAVLGAYMALLSREARAQIKAIAEKMTYLELSADNKFYDAFTSALFLPHTDMRRFPSVAALMSEQVN